MNERIIELANKANEQIGYTFRLEDAVQIHELMEKFAELIVRECSKVNNQYVGRRIGDIDLDIVYKKHFGVK